MTTRRDFLRYGGLAAAFALTGCPRTRARLPQCGHFDTDDGLSVIDTHCHIFNGSDLQVAGFVNEVHLGGPGWWVLHPLGRVLQQIAWKSAPSVAEERRWLRDRISARDEADGPHTAALADGPRWLEAYEQDSAQRLAAFFEQAQKRDPGAVEAFLGNVAMLHGGSGVVAPQLNARTLTRAEGLQAAFEAERTLAFKGLAPFSFLATFFRYRTQNAWAMLQMYGCDSTPGIDLLCPALVDFDLWIGTPGHDAGRTPSRIHDQVALMGEMARATGGRVLAYAPFNPLRAACDTSYAEPLFEAVRSGACGGMKLYPPMGFVAGGNADLRDVTFPACRPGEPPGAPPVPVSGARLDQVLGDFFETCAREGIPVMAHGAPSNAARIGHEKLAGPGYWRGLLGSYAEAFLGGDDRLRISLGHMGGGGRPDDSENSRMRQAWRAEIIELMAKYPERLFADLSYHEQILDPDWGTLRQQLGFLEGGAEAPARRQTMFGTDWSMLAMQSRSPEYLTRFVETLERLGVSDAVRRQVLGENARRFLGLTPDAPATLRRKRWLDGRA